jgi:hypothetical protein
MRWYRRSNPWRVSLVSASNTCSGAPNFTNVAARAMSCAIPSVLFECINLFTSAET